jgi:lipopolysaccharide export system ATP-binding protein
VTAAPEWVAALGDRDPSVPIGLAAIVRAAGPTETIAFSDLVHTYREAYLACYQPTGEADQEVSGDEVRHQLKASVLPRLATEGWILDTSSGYWQSVRPRVGWWGPTEEERQTVYEALLASARRAAQRAKSFTRHSASTSLLEGLDLTKSFKGRRVVDDVSVRVEQGEIVGLLGPNGAGKTTTFYLITGLIRPDEGRVRMDGVELTEMPMYQRARNGIGYLAQEPSVFRTMTVEEDVLAILETRGLGRDERYSRLDHMLDELSIKHLRKSKAYTLSGGERRRLEITRALVADPKFMLLDEPFAGVDPIAVHDIQTIVAGLRHRGIGVLITDHNVEQTLDIVDRAYIMFEGKVQAAGTVRDLVYDDRVAQLYLGPTLTARLRARLEAAA